MEERLAVEVDGAQHADSDYEAFRLKWLHEHGWRVVRFWNNEVWENRNGIAQAILLVLREQNHAE